MPGLVSYISSPAFANEITALRQQVMEGHIGGIRLGGESVRVSYELNTGNFLAESEGSGAIYAQLLNIALNNGAEALRNRMIRTLSAVEGVQRQENPNLFVQARISACTFTIDIEKLHCPGEALRCPITLDKPEHGVFIKNSGNSSVCTLFDSVSFSHLVREGGVHPLTREAITPSMIVKPEDCIFDSSKGNFIIKDG
ncbi:TPA: T3SS effector NleG family protein [Escherichia coli]|nr:T3SS effector NleG family protein [Escherichia coli]MED9025646.1 T3SS effector NleG family protein [Escherichia coli]MED9074876.1 T3SS effector NleG family protein [Escherichia coli]MED9319390.1 T3SS effector NleG family protein [Escherichia coli]HEL8008239.1 T3SS effector NleG family protein [Escherichia coli]